MDTLPTLEHEDMGHLERANVGHKEKAKPDRWLKSFKHQLKKN